MYIYTHTWFNVDITQHTIVCALGGPLQDVAVAEGLAAISAGEGAEAQVRDPFVDLACDCFSDMHYHNTHNINNNNNNNNDNSSW